MEVKRPFDFVNRNIGRVIVVGLKGGREVTGKLLAFDVHMNLVLSEAVMKTEEGEMKIKQMFIRGDSVTYLIERAEE